MMSFLLSKEVVTVIIILEVLFVVSTAIAFVILTAMRAYKDNYGEC